jgi:hypothetical protein
LRSLPLTRKLISAMEAPICTCEAQHSSGNVQKAK